MDHIFSKGVMIDSFAFTLHFISPPPPPTAHCTGLTSGFSIMLFLAQFNQVPHSARSHKYLQKDSQDHVSQKLPDQIKSSMFLWERMGRAWLQSQCHGWEPESGEAACLPPLSQRALFVACFHRLLHHGAPCPHNLFQAFFYSDHRCTSLPQALDTSKGKHVIRLSSRSAKKASSLLRDFCSSSADWSATPMHSFIYLPICLSCFHATSFVFLVHSLRMSLLLLCKINKYLNSETQLMHFISFNMNPTKIEHPALSLHLVWMSWNLSYWSFIL